jgi:hypothetical protein
MPVICALRGWIECGFERVPQIRSIVDSFFFVCEDFSITAAEAERFHPCWYFPTEDGPAGFFVFLGAEVYKRHLPFFEAQLHAIASNVVEIDGDDIYNVEGRFEVSIEGEPENQLWRMADGRLDTSGRMPWALF